MATKLDVAYQANVWRVRSNATRYAVAQWNGLGSWREADIERFAKKVLPRVETGQREVARLTDAYIRKQALNEFGTIKRGTVIDATTVSLRGISAEETYRRPFVTAYTALSDGASMTGALKAGQERLTDLVESGMQLAKTHAAQDTLQRTNFEAFQRVLSGRENCALCVIASTQRYNRGDLLPIHPGCDCDVKPLTLKFDKQVINQELLDVTHDEIALRLGRSELSARDLGLGKESVAGKPLSDYTDLLLTRQHGELGPMLTWRDQKFTSAADIAALA